VQLVEHQASKQRLQNRGLTPDAVAHHRVFGKDT